MPEERERDRERGREGREGREDDRDRDRDRDRTVVVIAEDCHERCEWEDDEWNRHRRHRRQECHRKPIEVESDVFNLILRNPYSIEQAAAAIFADQRKKNHRRAVEDAVDLFEIIEDIKRESRGREPEVGRFS